MSLTDFDFALPKELIAYEPAQERDGSRLLVLSKDGGTEHRRFSDLHEYLKPGDMLLLNMTKVLPFRLFGTKQSGEGLDILLVRNIEGKSWEILSRGSYTGPLYVSDRLTAHVHAGRTAEIEYEGDLRDILWEQGHMPLPPYIKRPANRMDKERYQTVYARDEGSIAAPTAGLHFTEKLLEKLKDKGVLLRFLTLHVGRGTFTPIRAEQVHDHQMEPECFEVQKSLLDEIKALRGRLIAVGTTTTRAIEGLLGGKSTGLTSRNGTLQGATDIFICPGHRFRAVTCLITNFHLPRSTPLMLTAALCGREKLLSAYSEAIGRRYRFFSYGDAMLIA
jgi:S-adenosylmethionine:tRNA ribosyltransferase-isomerase